MKVVIDADASGSRLKFVLCRYAEELGHEVTCMKGDLNDGYPDVAHGLATRVASGQFERGILICKSGLGMAMAANKVRGAYAAPCCDLDTAIDLARRKWVNVLTLGSAYVLENQAMILVKAFLETPFDTTSENAHRMRELESL